MNQPKNVEIRNQIKQALKDKVPQVEIARRLGVTKGRVSQLKKDIEFEEAKQGALEVAQREGLDILAQIKERNDGVLKIFRMLQAYSEGDTEVFRELEKELKRRGIRPLDPRNLLLQYSREIGNQHDQYLIVGRMQHHAQQVSEFQETVLEVIDSVDEEVRKEIEQRLKDRLERRGALRRTLQGD
jgi:transcriptional regulator with XRE-family HTH domain